MKKLTKKKLFIIICLVIVAVVVVNTALVVYLTSKSGQSNTPRIEKQIDVFSYKGEDGKDALVLLKKHASVEQDKSGLVVSINNRKADSAKHEYWAFYVNKKMAQVGPADYKTKNTDVIEWKIEKY